MWPSFALKDFSMRLARSLCKGAHSMRSCHTAQCAHTQRYSDPAQTGPQGSGIEIKITALSQERGCPTEEGRRGVPFNPMGL